MQRGQIKNSGREKTPATEIDTVAFIEANLISGKEPGLTQAFTLLQRSVDIDTQAKDRLSPHLCKYLTETNKTSHIVAAVYCLYVFSDMEPFKKLFLELGKSKRQRIRFAVASCLSNFATWDTAKEEHFGDKDIIDLAITLTRDSSPSVRDWSVFQFNNCLSNDSAAIHAALCERVNDTNLAVRQEAIEALTARGETRFYPLIKQKLKRIDVAPIWIGAAVASKDSTFVSDLESLLLKNSNQKPHQRREELEEAIATLSESVLKSKP